MTLLAARAISKVYPGVRALDGVDFELRGGEVHALLGENGAGKSTLVKVLSGAVAPDAGEVALEGRRVSFADPRAARRAGVAVVHQELALVPELSAAENVFLGREQGRPLLRRTAMRRQAQRLLDGLGGHVDARAAVRSLSVAQRQTVEIARALLGESRVLILDEPSASLSSAEVERLFAALATLKARGLGIVYISHRLEEVSALADRVTVLRDGRHVATAGVGETGRAQLIRWMVGRDVSEEFPPRTSAPGPTVMEAKALSAPPRLRSASFTLRAGEIVGVAGLVGSGRTSLGLAVFGALPARGEVLLEGRSVRFRSPADAIAAGLGYVTEDRQARGLFPLLSAGENMTVSYLRVFARAGLLSTARERTAAEAAALQVDLRGARPGQRAATLSGGNQQKLLLGRYLLRPRRVLILDEPTRGIDVGAKAEIYALMNRLTAEGLAVLMISSELPEVLALSDRVLVMHEGRTVGELSRDQATAESVMHLATGGR